MRGQLLVSLLTNDISVGRQLFPDSLKILSKLTFTYICPFSDTIMKYPRKDTLSRKRFI
jgi:hypothetical protein